MLTINEYLDNILFDFREYVSSGVELCDLKDVHFDAGRVPDYSNLHVQQLYLLRYAYAYAFEYKRMYRSLIRKMRLNGAISVTSIGCGSMLDYWALAQTVPSSCKIFYQGIDIIDWAYLVEGRPEDDVCFVEGNVLDVLGEVQAWPSDAYIFPKSISEFSRTDIESICMHIGSISPAGTKVYCLFSLRTDERSMDRDIAKTRQFFSAMLSNGFSSESNPNTYTILSQELQGQKISAVDPDFRHPWQVVNFITTELHACCAQYNGQHCKDDCERRLSRWPILKCQQARWQLFEFTKEG